MNKGQIRAHFLALLNRTDCSDTLADTFVDQSITRIERVMRIPPMEKSIDYAISAQTTFLTIPNDFLEITGLYHGSTNLVRVSLAKFIEFTQNGQSGTPKYFTREADKIKIYPYPTTGAVTMNYYASFPEMTSDSDQNDLALIGSDLIVYGALSYAADYFLDERGQVFEGKFVTGVTEIQQQANDAETSGTVQVIQAHTTYEDL
tara:strand:- start:34 stop:645 length:612 start_codon:yes stop_codon:yes gene_type:complete